jgi:hypothetical protein
MESFRRGGDIGPRSGIIESDARKMAKAPSSISILPKWTMSNLKPELRLPQTPIITSVRALIMQRIIRPVGITWFWLRCHPFVHCREFRDEALLVHAWRTHLASV